MATATRRAGTSARRKSDYIARPPKWLRELAADSSNPMLLFTEERWARDVAGAFRGFGWTAYHTHNSEHSPSGFPDWVAWRIRHHHARLLFVELKRQDKTPTEAQATWLAGLGEISASLRALLAFAFPADAPIPMQLDRVAIEVYVWRPGDWKQVLEVLR